MTEDLTPYMDGLTPDPEGVRSARTYADFTRPAPLQRLEEFTMSLTFFYKEQGQREAVRPTMTTGLTEALRVFLFAASGFFAILEDTRPITGQAGQDAADWKALSFGLQWARSQRTEAGAGLSLEDKEALDRALINPHMLPLLPAWACRMRDAGQIKEGARFAVWAALTRLLEAAPFLTDGEIEGLLSELLEAFGQVDTPTA